MSIGQELGRMSGFAERNGNSQEAEERLKRRLAQDRRPNTRTSTEQWINWSSLGDMIGQPYSLTKIPISKLEEMQRDPMLSFGLTFIKVPLVRAPWYIQSTDAKRAAFVDAALRRIYGRFILAYSNCFSFGYSAMVKRFEYFKPDWTYIEKDDEAGTEKPVWDDPKIDALVWKPFIPLNPRFSAPHWNSKGEFAGIDFSPSTTGGAYGTTGFPFDQISGNQKVADIPLDWALWATNEKDSVYGSLWGYPRLGYAYRYWWSYWYKFGLSDRAFEKWADPPVFVYHPTEDAYTDPNDPDTLVNFSDEAIALAEKIRSGANASLPSEVQSNLEDGRLSGVRKWEVTQLESKTNFDALDATFKYLDVLKLRSMMVPEQSLVEGQGGSSSRNVAEKFGDIFQESQAVVMEEIDDLLNRYVIPQLLEANFGTGGPTCTKITTGFNRQDIEAMRSILEVFANKDMPMPVDVREALEYLGVPTMSPSQFSKELDRRAKEQEAQVGPPVIQAQGGKAGVTQTGLYYDDRERITITLSQDELKSYLNKIADKTDIKTDDETAKIAETLLSEIEKLHDKTDKLAPGEPPVVNVEVNVPDKQEPQNKRVRKTIVRDEGGDIAYIDEEEVDDERTQS